MRKIVVFVLLAAVVAAGVWWFVGRDGAGVAGGKVDANAPLAFVPADTPYLFANLEPLPQDTTDRWLAQFAATTQLWRSQIALMQARLATEDTPDAKRIRAWIGALDAELGDKTMPQVLADNGLTTRPLIALYGIGLAPVMRMELADAAKFRAMVARVEQRAGETLPTATLDDVGYWYFAIPETQLRILLALQGNHLVLTLGPANDDTALRTVLGITRPADSMRNPAALLALNTKFNYLPYGSGYVDSGRIVALLTAAPTPLETALLAAVKIEKPAIDATCATEYALLAALVPRLSAGYTHLDGNSMDMLSRIETLPKIASDLMLLRTPMPGARAAKDSLLDFGFGVKASAIPGVMNGWADIAQTHTWACAQLTDLNEAPAQLRAAGSNAAIYTAAPVFSAFHAIATRADVASFSTGTPDASGKVLISSGNPAALLAMAKNFVPEFATLDIKPDGKVVVLPAPAASPLQLPMFAAMSNEVLAIGVGADQQATLADDLKLDPAFQPLLVYGFTGAFYAQIAKLGLDQAALAGDPAAQAEAERMSALVTEIYTKSIKRMDVAVDVDEHGVRFTQHMEMP